MYEIYANSMNNVLMASLQIGKTQKPPKKNRSKTG